MSLLEFPNPMAWIASAKDDEQKREIINATASALYSAQISFLWRSGSSRWIQYIGEGKALQDAATAIFLSLEPLQKKNFLTLAVPVDMLENSNITRFQVSYKSK